MVSWLLVAGVIVIICYGLYTIYLRRRLYQRALDRFSASIRKELEELEGELRENRRRLQELSQDMNKIMDELSWKEKSIKRTIDSLRVNPKEIEDGDLPREQPEQGSFKELLDSKLENVKQENIPDRYLEILELHKQGLSIEEIAEKLDLGVRETGLIFKLYGGERDFPRNKQQL